MPRPARQVDRSPGRLGRVVAGAVSAASLANDDPTGYHHWGLDYQPGDGDTPSQVTVTVSDLVDEPAADLTTEISLYPGWDEEVWDDHEEGDTTGGQAASLLARAMVLER